MPPSPPSTGSDSGIESFLPCPATAPTMGDRSPVSRRLICSQKLFILLPCVERTEENAKTRKGENAKSEHFYEENRNRGEEFNSCFPGFLIECPFRFAFSPEGFPLGY